MGFFFFFYKYFFTLLLGVETETEDAVLSTLTKSSQHFAFFIYLGADTIPNIRLLFFLFKVRIPLMDVLALMIPCPRDAR
jgi:hypothetical protein